MTIGVFSRRTRLSLKALRLYERQGLLVPDHVDPGQGYRRYSEAQLDVARTIAQLRRLDMPLAVVADVIAATPSEAAELVAAYWDRVEERIAHQRELATHLRVVVSGGDATHADYQVSTRRVPDVTILSELRHVRIDELEPWRHAAAARLAEAASTHGGAAGDAYAVFHGEVTEDGDGPVELCQPIHGSPAHGEDAAEEPLPPWAAARVDAAHEEAYVRVSRAQYAYPQILSVYDVLAAWIRANGRSFAGPSREAPLAALATGVAPGDLVCDVSFPISSSKDPSRV